MTRIVIALMAALVGSGWLTWHYRQEAIDARAKSEAATRSIAALEAQAAEAERLSRRAENLKEEIDNAPDNCPAPDWLRNLPDWLRFDDAPGHPPFAY